MTFHCKETQPGEESTAEYRQRKAAFKHLSQGCILYIHSAVFQKSVEEQHLVSVHQRYLLSLTF